MTRAADKQFVSNNIIISEISGEDSSFGISTSLIPASKLSKMLSFNSENKAGTTLEQLFIGMANQSGIMLNTINSGQVPDSGFWPFINYDDPEYNDESNNSLISRFGYGVNLTVGKSGTIPPIKSVGFAMPMYAAGFGYDVNNYFTPANKTVAIEIAYNSSTKSTLNNLLAIQRTNHLLISGNSIAIGNSQTSSYNTVTQVIKIIDKDNFIVNIPYVNPVLTDPDAGRYNAINIDPYAPSGLGYPNGAVNTIDYTNDVLAWKCGPIDLRWDASRQVWCGSDFFKSNIIYGYLASDINPALGRNNPTPFKINTYVTQTLPIYITSFALDTSATTDGGTIINLVPNNLELQPTDNFYINDTGTSYDGEQVLVQQSADRTQLFIDVPYDPTANSIVSQIGFVTQSVFNNGNSIPRLIDKTYIIMNYDTHLSVKLNSKCLDLNNSCANVEDDIFIIAIQKSPNDIRCLYVGYGDY